MTAQLFGPDPSDWILTVAMACALVADLLLVVHR